jgi:hypothetical protein
MTERDVGRRGEVVADRLRHLAPHRLTPVAAQIEVLLRRLAALASEADGQPPTPLELPERRAWGDVVDVLAADLARALTARPDPDLEDSTLDVLSRLRRLLP